METTSPTGFPAKVTRVPTVDFVDIGKEDAEGFCIISDTWMEKQEHEDDHPDGSNDKNAD